jgi:hypothetical protein
MTSATASAIHGEKASQLTPATDSVSRISSGA